MTGKSEADFRVDLKTLYVTFIVFSLARNDFSFKENRMIRSVWLFF